MTRRIGLIALAVVLALAGTLAVYSYVHNADQRAIAGTEATTVLVAQKQVPPATSWSDAVAGGYFTAQRVPSNTVPTGALRNVHAPVPGEQVTAASIAAGQVVVREMFARKAATTGLLQLPKGDLALSVSLPSNADVAGFVQSGSQVAIFTTMKVVPTGKSPSQEVSGGTDLYSTKLLLPRIDVLAVSQDAPSDLNGGKASTTGPASSSTNLLVTLAVSQQEAERVLLAQQVGQLYLGLLSQDSRTAADGGVLNVVDFHPSPIFVK